MKVLKNKVKVANAPGFGEGILEIVDIDINEISGVLIQDNSNGKFIQVYDHDGKSILRSTVFRKD